MIEIFSAVAQNGRSGLAVVGPAGTMQDKELLQAAAKAAGLNYEPMLGGYYTDPEFNEVISWNPLTNDGDALRLAAKMHLSSMLGSTMEPLGADKAAAMRRAIVRASAAMPAALDVGAA